MAKATARLCEEDAESCCSHASGLKAVTKLRGNKELLGDVVRLLFTEGCLHEFLGSGDIDPDGPRSGVRRLYSRRSICAFFLSQHSERVVQIWNPVHSGAEVTLILSVLNADIGFGSPALGHTSQQKHLLGYCELGIGCVFSFLIRAAITHTYCNYQCVQVSDDQSVFTSHTIQSASRPSGVLGPVIEELLFVAVVFCLEFLLVTFGVLL